MGLTQAITTAATGNGTCTPPTHQCVDGENLCVDNADCVLGAANNPSTECTASCELLTQAITTAATGNGTCTPLLINALMEKTFVLATKAATVPHPLLLHQPSLLSLR